MNLIKTKYEDLAKKFFLSYEQLLQESLKSYLFARKKDFLNERFDILLRYTVRNAGELEAKIEKGLIPEHPSWEDLIDLRNLEKEIQEIDNDISCL